ncbi:aldo/keto reductase [Pelagibacterium xiamenense]|uniref:aldo/keto reductase n=1 Tax=Pelagibacterium xiamenense TaxID=2901140 RepID=UPI001E5A767B|nr:aldo/keto reductase [Pelagibacterium xiamenense]MCD7059325.1 aldo/keto reductase [Pelagibacterium xiamenense]
MQRSEFGKYGTVSRLTLGGGGIGQVWGETSREEGIATLKMAIDEGIDVLDAAPGYNVCEALIGEAFNGRLPEHIKVTTKYGLASAPGEEAYSRFRASLEESLKAMRLDRVDLLFLHNEIRPDVGSAPEGHTHFTRWSVYRDYVIPAFERLMDDGLIGGWGLTGVAKTPQILDALSTVPRPHAVQAVANLLDSPGGLVVEDEQPRHREIIATAQRNEVGVMGIRAVQAGALTRRFDRDVPEGNRDLPDFDKAAPFRALCAEWGEDPAIVAHRYALGIEGVDTLVLGVKNRAELKDALAAEAAGPLDAEQVQAIEDLGLRPNMNRAA